MSKIKKSMSVLIACVMLAVCFCMPASAEFDKNALSTGIYQLNVIHAAKIPELDDATFTVWLSAVCFAVGSSDNGTTYVMTDSNMGKNDRIFDTLGDKLIEFFDANGVSIDKSELKDHVEITYTAYYAVCEGSHVVLNPVDQYSSRDIMLFTAETYLPSAKYTYAYADEAKADSIVYAFSINGEDVDGIISSSDDAYITNWSFSTHTGKIKIPADIQDGSTARTYTDIPQLRSAQGSPVFDDNGNIIGLYSWTDTYDGMSPVTSTAMMNILDGIGISYDVAQTFGNSINSSEIMLYIYVAAVVVVVLIVALIVLRTRKRKIEEEEASRGTEQRKNAAENSRAQRQSSDDQARKQNSQKTPVQDNAKAAADNAAKPAVEHTVTLTVLGGDMHGYSKVVDRPLILGRDPEKCNVVFPADLTCISRVHCTVTYNKQTGRILLEDLQSSNGTYFPSGSRIIPGRLYALRSGDRFYLGLPENTVEVRMK